MGEGEFVSWRSFHRFQFEVRRERRYVRSAEAQAFLGSVAATCATRLVDIPDGRIFWRAQLAHEWRSEPQVDDEVPCAASPSRMRPLPDRAAEGRINPKGIPCLYLATERDTAMSEVRPWIGSLISVAQFRTLRPLKVVDCSQHHGSWQIFFEEPAPEKRAEAVWAWIDRAFSEPTTRSDDTADYAATQVIAELFRDLGYDGVVYKSAFGERGFNIALFNIEDADLINCGLFETKAASYQFSEADNPYFVRSKSDAD